MISYSLAFTDEPSCKRVRYEEDVLNLFQQSGRHLSWQQAQQMLNEQDIFADKPTCQAACRAARKRWHPPRPADPALVGFEGAGASMALPVEDGGRGKRQKRPSVMRVDMVEQQSASSETAGQHCAALLSVGLQHSDAL